MSIGKKALNYLTEKALSTVQRGKFIASLVSLTIQKLEVRGSKFPIPHLQIWGKQQSLKTPVKPSVFHWEEYKNKLENLKVSNFCSRIKFFNIWINFMLLNRGEYSYESFITNGY